MKNKFARSGNRLQLIVTLPYGLVLFLKLGFFLNLKLGCINIKITDYHKYATYKKQTTQQIRRDFSVRRIFLSVICSCNIMFQTPIQQSDEMRCTYINTIAFPLKFQLFYLIYSTVQCIINYNFTERLTLSEQYKFQRYSDC